MPLHYIAVAAATTATATAATTAATSAAAAVGEPRDQTQLGDQSDG